MTKVFITRVEIDIEMQIDHLAKWWCIMRYWAKISVTVAVKHYDVQLLVPVVKKNADALDDLLPAFKATALPSQSITGDPLDPPLVPDAAYRKTISEYKNGSLGFSCNNTKTYITQCLVTAVAENHLIIETTILVTAKF